MDRLLAETDERIKRQLPPREMERRTKKIIEQVCAKEGINGKVLASGSRRGELPRIRSDLAEILTGEVGLSLAECARQFGVTTAAVAQMLKRRKYKK